jgi:hypothetical protein
MSERALPRGFIVGPGYDLALFFGGALGSFAVYALFRSGVPLLWLWWAWYFIDSTHLAATLTRTYIDPAARAAQRRLLRWSPAVYLIGPAAVAAGWLAGSSAPFLIFLAVASAMSQLHIIRQHYGFVALYKQRGRERDPIDFRLDKLALYAALWAPNLHFVLATPATRRLLGLPPEIAGVQRAVLWALLGVTLVATLVPVARAAALFARGVRPNLPKVGYMVFASAVNAFVYLVASQAQLPAENAHQPFMLVTLMTTLFHDVQYHGLVWLVNRSRHASGSPPAVRVPAATVLGYAAFCGLFAALYWLPSCMTGWYAGCPKDLSLSAAPLRDALYGGVVWGATLHHYLLDTGIWRVKSDTRLLHDLGMGAPAAS